MKCLNCGKELTKRKQVKYCSNMCYHKFPISEETKKTLSKSRKDYLKTHEHPKGMLGKKHNRTTRNLLKEKRIGRKPAWRGGKTTSLGYILIYMPEHPFSVKKYVKEHRLVMEKHLGRYLTKNEVVHHKNSVRNDNRIENLVILTKSQHSTLHGNQRTNPLPCCSECGKILTSHYSKRCMKHRRRK